MTDERTLVSNLATYISELPQFFAQVEVHPSKKDRMDIVVEYEGETLFTGEFKRPFVIEGRNPRNIDLVSDANDKASKYGSRFFVTSNFNDTVLWDRSDTSRPLMSQDVDEFPLPIKVKRDEDFDRKDIVALLKSHIKDIAQKILDRNKGRIATHYRPLGESFIMGLNSHLRAAAEEAYDYIPNSLLYKWRKETNSLVSSDQEEKIRLAKYSLYVLSNKVMFYYYLKKTFTRLPDIEEHKARRVSELKNIVNKAFEQAQEKSQDYETVFRENEYDNIPFFSDVLVKPVSSLLKFYRDYNFDSMSQDILGNLYDRLISPDERYSFGQYFTPIPVVDLINALTIKSGKNRVLDPACGSGTFLTRAFDLKLKLLGKDTKKIRETVLSQLFGVDIARYPVHLATLALASKLKLANPSLYPQVIRSDFLDVPTRAVVPKWRQLSEDYDPATSDFSDNDRIVNFKPIDSVVGNLPYIETKQMDNKEREPEQKKVSDFLTNNGYESITPSGLADFHTYFWYYVLPFLSNGSRVGFLTSDTWLNVGYGDELKRFIAKHFKIIAIIDSSIERWFEDALVNTSITIIERCEDKKERSNNMVKFIRLTKKVETLVPDIETAISIAHKIENSHSKIVEDGIVITREVRQSKLNFRDQLKSKLYPYLRAPDIFFKYIEKNGFVPIRETMDIKFGIKTGADAFFTVKDITNNLTDKDLKDKFGLRKGETDNIRIIKDGTGQPHRIESEYLKPFLKGPREFTKEGRLLVSDITDKMLVLIQEMDKSAIKKDALTYIRYGETKPDQLPYYKTPSIIHRKPWWKLSPIIMPDVIFPQGYSDKFIFPKGNILLHARLYFGIAKDKSNSDLLYSYFNSSLFYPFPDFYGRVGGGGIVELKVYELENIKIPKPELLEPYREELKTIMQKLEGRKVGNVYEEIWDLSGDFDLSKVKPDRLHLDKTILKALGIENQDEFLLKWYPMVVNIIKERTEKAKSLRKTSSDKNRGLTSIADEIVEGVEIKHFFKDYIAINEYEKTLEFAEGTTIEFGYDLFSTSEGAFVSVDDVKKYVGSTIIAKYCYYSVKCGEFVVEIPSESRAKEAIQDFEDDLAIWKNLITKEITQLTSDHIISEKLLRLCSIRSGLSDLIS